MGKSDAPREERWTLLGLESLQKHLPGCEIVLSTWKGADAADLPCDILVQSNDPGSLRLRPWEEDRPDNYSNTNRQIVSTLAGVKAATRPYVLKIRSDMVLNGAGFLNYFNRYTERVDEWKVTRERVLCCTTYSSNPRRERGYCFHPSDWVYFGLREDVLDLWELPLQSDEVLHALRAEQVLWVAFLQKHGAIEFNDYEEKSPELLRLSELTIANNLVLLNMAQWQAVAMRKRAEKFRASLYSAGEWVRLYNAYCGGKERPGPDLESMAKRVATRLHFARRFISYGLAKR